MKNKSAVARYLFPGLMILILAIGGSSRSYVWIDALVQACAAGAVVFYLISGQWRTLSALPFHFRLLIAGAVLLPMIQLIPLPPAIWQAVAGRGLERDTLDFVGLSQSWRPLSILPDATRTGILALLVPSFGFLLFWTASYAQLQKLLIIILAVTLISAIIGAIQVATRGTIFGFWENFYAGSANGIFANHNHQADFLSLGFLLCMFFWREGRARGLLYKGVLAAGVGLLSFGVLLTASRAGITLFLVVALISIFTELTRFRRGVLFGTGAFAFGLIGIAGIMMLSDNVRAVFARFETVASDERGGIWAATWDMSRHFPLSGTGFNTFEAIYPVYEPYAIATDSVANAAHNDYLEYLATGGMLAAVLMILFGVALFRCWRICRTYRDENRSDLLRFSGLGLAVLLLHSIVDYPLQTASLAFLCAATVAIVMRLSYAAESLELPRRPSSGWGSRGGRDMI